MDINNKVIVKAKLLAHSNNMIYTSKVDLILKNNPRWLQRKIKKIENDISKAVVRGQSEILYIYPWWYISVFKIRNIAISAYLVDHGYTISSCNSSLLLSWERTGLAGNKLFGLMRGRGKWLKNSIDYKNIYKVMLDDHK